MVNDARPRAAAIRSWLTERRQKVGSATGNVWRAFGLVWQAHHKSAAAMAVCTLIGAFIPVTQAWVGKLIVDTVVSALNRGMSPQAGLRASRPISWWSLLVVLQTAM